MGRSDGPSPLKTRVVIAAFTLGALVLWWVIVSQVDMGIYGAAVTGLIIGVGGMAVVATVKRD